MTRTEIQGWLQVVIGLAGIWATTNWSGAALDALGQASMGGDMPPEFQGAQGAIRAFLTLLVLTTLLFISFTGLAVVLGGLFRHLKAVNPLTTAFTLMGGLAILPLTLTAAIFGQPIWIMGMMLSVGLFCAAGVAACSTVDKYWDTLGGVIAVSVLLGGVGIFFATLVNISDAPQSGVTEPAVAEASR